MKNYVSKLNFTLKNEIKLNKFRKTFNFSKSFNIFTKNVSQFHIHTITFKKFCEKKENLDGDSNTFPDIMQEFEKLLTSEENTLEVQEKRVKLLSIKLLQMTKASEVIQLYDEKYSKNLVNNVYGEELTLFIYFYVSLLEKELSSQVLYHNPMHLDKRFSRIIDQLIEENKFKDLDIDNIIALSWAFSLLITKFNYNLKPELRKYLLEKLPLDLEINKKGDLPMIIFSISSFLTNLDEKKDKNVIKEISDLTHQLVVRYSYLFFSDLGLDYINPLNLSLFALSWTRLNITDTYLLNQLIDNLNKIKDSLTEENIEEVSKMFWAFSTLNHKNKILPKLIEEYMTINADRIPMIYLLDIFISISNLLIEEKPLIMAMMDLIVENQNSQDSSFDVNTYTNLWLGMSKFCVKTNENMENESINHFVKFLISSYDKRKYLHVQNMTTDDICSVLVCNSVLMAPPSNLTDDILKYCKNNLEKLSNNNLIQVLSAGRFYGSFQKHFDLYNLIHDFSLKTKEPFNNKQLDMLKKIIKNDGFIPNSPYLNN